MTRNSFQTTDVDEANAMANEVFYESLVEPVRGAGAGFRFAMKYDSAGPVGYALLSHACEVQARAGGLDMTYCLGVPLNGAFPIRFRHEDVTADPRTAAVCTPTTHVSYRGYHTGTERLFLLSFDQAALENQLRMLLGLDRVRPIPLATSLDLRTARGAQWWRIASSLLLDLQTSGGLASNPMMTSDLSGSILTGLLLAVDHPFRDDLATWASPVPPATIRKAIAIIEARAHEPLTIPEIASEIGCSVRALQAGYRKHLDMTPREHIGRVRMERAHAMLQSAHPDSASVGEIAAKWGFKQPGRFSGEYRKVYGVSPHITLRDG